MPERYVHTTGTWKSPPGEQAAQVHGLFYRVRTSSGLHPLVIQNLKFLQDFWIHPYPVTPAQETQVAALLSTTPGISITQLQDASPDLPVDVLWALLTQQRVFTDLSAASLMHADAAQKPWIQLDWRKLAHEPDQPALYPDRELLALRFLSLERADSPTHA